MENDGLCGQAALVARAPRPVAARARRAGRDLAAPPELPRARPRRAEPRDGAAAGRRARRAAAPAERAAAGRRLRAGVARERSGRAGTRPGRSALDYMLAPAGAVPGLRRRPALEPAPGQCGAVRLVEFLVGPLPPDAPINLADALVAPDVLRPFLVNWEEVVRYFLRSVQADAPPTAAPRRGAARAAARLSRRAAPSQSAASSSRAAPVLAMHFRKGETVAAPVHDDRDARHAAGRHAAGDPHRDASSRWTRRRPKSFVPGQEVRRAADRRADHAERLRRGHPHQTPCAVPGPRQAFGDQRVAQRAAAPLDDAELAAVAILVPIARGPAGTGRHRSAPGADPRFARSPRVASEGHLGLKTSGASMSGEPDLDPAIADGVAVDHAVRLARRGRTARMGHARAS